MNWKGYGRKLLWLNLRHIPVSFWRHWGKSRKISVRISVVRAEVQTEHLQNMNLERFRYADALSEMCVSNGIFFEHKYASSTIETCLRECQPFSQNISSSAGRRTATARIAVAAGHRRILWRSARILCPLIQPPCVAGAQQLHPAHTHIAASRVRSDLVLTR
jgi:hypothetical protein